MPPAHEPLAHQLSHTVEDDLHRLAPGGAAVDALPLAEVERIEPEHPTSGSVVGMIGVLVAAALIMMLNETVLSVALPAVMSDLNITAATGQWLTTGFMLTMAVVIPTTGYLLQRFTTRTLFVGALTLFLIGTLVAAAAHTFPVLLLARVIQAVGTAVILPQLMATTLTVVPPAHRGAVMGLNSVVISAAPALGPTMSGVIIDSLSWRWLFGIMVPIAVVVLIAGVFLLKTDGQTRRTPLDVPSVLLSVVAFGGIVYALSSMSAVFDGVWVLPLVSVVVGVVGLVTFVRRQQTLGRSGAALLDLRPLSIPTYRISAGIVAIAMAAMLGTVVVLPIYLQAGLAVSSLATGFLLLPGGLIQGLVSPIAGRLYDKHGPRPLVIPGTLLMFAGQVGLVFVGTSTSIWYVIAAHVVFCVGMALVMTSLMTVALASLPPTLYGHGSAIMNTLQQLAGAAGTALLVAGLTVGASLAGGAAAAAVSGGARAAFLIGAVITIVGVLLAPLVRQADHVHAPASAEPAQPEPSRV